MKRESELMMEIAAFSQAIKKREKLNDPADAAAIMRAKRKLAGLRAKLDRLRDRQAKAVRP